MTFFEIYGEDKITNNGCAVINFYKFNNVTQIEIIMSHP